MRNPWIWTSRDVLVGVLLTTQVTVAAQDKATVTAPGAALEVITVTAQRRVQASQAVPIAIAALTGDSMENPVSAMSLRSRHAFLAGRAKQPETPQYAVSTAGHRQFRNIPTSNRRLPTSPTNCSRSGSSAATSSTWIA